jgi:hypothetical protein
LPNEGERLAPESPWLRNLASEAIVGEPPLAAHRQHIDPTNS